MNQAQEFLLQLLRGGYQGSISHLVESPQQQQEESLEEIEHRRFSEFIRKYRDFGLAISSQQDHDNRRRVFRVEWDVFGGRESREVSISDRQIMANCRRPWQVVDFCARKVEDVVESELGFVSELETVTA